MSAIAEAKAAHAAHLTEAGQVTVEDDFELLRLWGQGNRDAGAVLFERHVEAVRRFFSNKVSDPADLIQTTFLACLEDPQRFQGRSSFRTYLLSIAKFQLYGHYRAKGVWRERANLNASSILDRGPSPSSQLARADRDRNLLLALRTIPLQLQIILELAYWEDLGGQELAEVLDIPVGTVYTRMHRARQRLRQALDLIEASNR